MVLKHQMYRTYVNIRDWIQKRSFW